MADLPMQTQQPQQAPPGPQQDPGQVGNAPLQQRMAQFQGPQPATPQQPQQDPRVAAVAKHAMLGKAMSDFMGGGDPSQPKSPGQWGRSMVMGAMMGLAGVGGGGFLGGLGKGAASAQQNAQQQQDRQRAQTEQQRRNKIEDEKNQREAQGFQTEQEMRRATIAHENLETLRTQQTINAFSEDRKFGLYQREAENSIAKFSPYRAAGVAPMADNKSQQEMDAIIKANPKATAWDWEQTGVKTILTTDKAGNTTSSYAPVYSAFDKDASVPLTKEYLDLLKQSKIDTYYPGTTEKLRVGQSIPVQQFSVLTGQYEKAHQQTLANENEKLKNGETSARIRQLDAAALKDSAEAGRASKDEKNSQLLDRGLTEWNKTFDEMKKTDPNATTQDALKQLSAKNPKAAFAIAGTLTKEIDSLEKSIIEAKNQNDQARADELKQQQETLRGLQTQALGINATTAIPKATTQGMTAPVDVAKRALSQSGGDMVKANKLLVDQGYADDPAAHPAAPSRGDVTPILESGAKNIYQAGKKAVGAVRQALQ
jgi:hypothetical protein